MSESNFSITREKHLDHLVRVVPLIVLAYGIQSYVLMQMRGTFGGATVFILGGMLTFLICCFLLYDTKHKVTLFNDHLEINFIGIKTICKYEDILSIKVSDPKETFGTVTIFAKHRKIRFYFADDVDKIKQWIECRQQNCELAA
jgi:hypothetical protein